MSWRRWTLYGLLPLLVVFCGAWFFASRWGVNPPLPKIFSQSPPPILSYLKVAEGFRLTLFARDLEAPRMLHITQRGDVLVSLPHDGSVLLLRDTDGDGRADSREALLEDLNRPHGLDVHEGWLYVAETDAIGRVAFDSQTGKVSGTYQRILTGLPSGSGHWTRTVKVGPDGWVYVTVGSSCNVCLEDAAERAAMLRLRPDGSGKTLYATGLRNSVDFDWSPIDNEIYATENARDWLGDEFPPDELNRIVEGGFYGWPYANGNKISDPDFGGGQPALVERSIAPAFEFRAHNAPLGITFLAHQRAKYQHAALVALHGSWNRSTKDGYKVVSLHWRDDGVIEIYDFVVGFLQGEEVLGRPVGVAEGADGSVYISDDYAGLIYRAAPEESSK